MHILRLPPFSLRYQNRKSKCKNDTQRPGSSTVHTVTVQTSTPCKMPLAPTAFAPAAPRLACSRHGVRCTRDQAAACKVARSRHAWSRATRRHRPALTVSSVRRIARPTAAKRRAHANLCMDPQLCIAGSRSRAHSRSQVQQHGGGRLEVTDPSVREARHRRAVDLYTGNRQGRAQQRGGQRVVSASIHVWAIGKSRAQQGRRRNESRQQADFRNGATAGRLA